jgi:hypothetical protein
VHVADFDIVLGACQELDEFHSLSSNRAPGSKDLDFSVLRHVVLEYPRRSRCCLEGSPAAAAQLIFV